VVDVEAPVDHADDNAGSGEWQLGGPPGNAPADPMWPVRPMIAACLPLLDVVRERSHSGMHPGRIRRLTNARWDTLRANQAGGLQAHDVRVRPHPPHSSEREAAGRDTAEAGHDPDARRLDAWPPEPDDRLDDPVRQILAQ
jgi:hypothetical protein